MPDDFERMVVIPCVPIPERNKDFTGVEPSTMPVLVQGIQETDVQSFDKKLKDAREANNDAAERRKDAGLRTISEIHEEMRDSLVQQYNVDLTGLMEQEFSNESKTDSRPEHPAERYGGKIQPPDI